MKFLLDANLSPQIAESLRRGGHLALHVRDLGMLSSPDEAIMQVAREQGLVVVSQDTDFTNLLAYQRATAPSLILLRDLQQVSAEDLAGLILANLEQIERALSEGAVASFVRDRIRVRHLPIG